MRHVIRTFGHRRLPLLVLVAVFTVAVGAEAQAANRGKVVRYWDRQLHTGGTIQLLDYRVLRCGPSACIVRWHIRAFIPGDESDLGGFNEYVGDDACYPAVRVACDTREPTVRWVAAGGGGPASSSARGEPRLALR
jgi:hypothetical protein